MPGFELDEDTAGLWQMDEAAAGNYTSIIDETAGVRHLTASASTAPEIVNAHNQAGDPIQFAKQLVGSATKAELAGDATALSTYQGDHTLEALVCMNSLAARSWIWAYGGPNDTSSTTNHQSSLIINTDGRPAEFWEHGTGTNDDVPATSTPVLAVDEWAYVAAVVDRTANEVRFAVRRMQDGACSFQTVAYTNDPTGGGDATVKTLFGFNGSAGAPEYATARVACVRISTIKRSDAELEAQADKLETTMKFDEDASTFGLYLMNEQPDAIDDSDTGHHAQAFGTIVHGVDPLTDTGFAKYFSGTSSELRCPRGPLAAALNTLFKGESCIEMLLRIGDGNTAVRGLTIFGDPGPEDAPNNWFGWELYQTPARSIRSGQEHGAGIDATDITPALYTAGQAVGKHVWALNTRIVAGDQVHDIYLDGVLVDTSAALTLYSDGEDGFFRIGYGIGSGFFFGVIDCVRLSNRARTAEELLESYERVTSDTSPPVIGTPSPAAGSEIDRLTVVTVPITDDIGVDSLTVVVTTGGEDLAAYDDGAFSDFFTAGGSQLTGPVTARVLTLRPGGGWSGPVSIRVTARDANGNQDVLEWSYTVDTSSTSTPAPAPIAVGSGGFGLVP